MSNPTGHTDPTDLEPALISPLQPHVIVLFGGAGDLARRKLLPGLMHLWQAGLMPECRIVATSLEDFDDDRYRAFAHQACAEFCSTTFTDQQWASFGRKISYVQQSKGTLALAETVAAKPAAAEAAQHEALDTLSRAVAEALCEEAAAEL